MEKGLYFDTLFCKYNNYFADYTCFFFFVFAIVLCVKSCNYTRECKCVLCTLCYCTQKAVRFWWCFCIISFNSIINLLGISLSYIELSVSSLIKEKRNLDFKSSITTKRRLAKSESATRRGWRASERGPGNKTDGGINSADTLRRISLPGPRTVLQNIV